MFAIIGGVVVTGIFWFYRSFMRCPEGSFHNWVEIESAEEGVDVRRCTKCLNTVELEIKKDKDGE